MDQDFEWPLPLRHRPGAPYNLGGIDVFYDIEWSDYFFDGRMQFRNGKCLAEQAFRACPEGKTAALLLTQLKDKEESFESDGFFVLAINFPQYLALADANAAVSYLARSLGSGITNVGQLSELGDRKPDELRKLLELELTAEQVGEWAAGNARRIADLRKVIGDSAPSGPADPREIVAAIRALEHLDGGVIAALAEVLHSVDREGRHNLLRALTNSPDGRRDAGEVLGRRAAERLSDARAAINKYSSLLEDEKSTETTFQHFIEENLWLLGLDYVQMRPRHEVPRGTLDFILERFDGFSRPTRAQVSPGSNHPSSQRGRWATPIRESFQTEPCAQQCSRTGPRLSRGLVTSSSATG
jgi:hypothetical protein